MNSPKVTIIILNWNGADDTLALLQNLGSLTYPNFSTLIVDNASTDDSVGQIARYMEQHRDQPIALLPLSKNFGFAEGNNKGVAQASREQPDYYLLLNNDTILTDDLLDRLVAAAESDPKLAAVGPTIYFADPTGRKSKQVWFAGGWFNFYAGGAHHKVELPADRDGLQSTEFLTGCCLLIKRNALNNLGQLFDPLFFAYGEDADLSLRLAKKGWRLGYVPNATMWHKLATSSGGPKSANFWYYNVRNNFLLMSRYAKWQHWPVFLLYFLGYKPVMVSLLGAIFRPRTDKPRRLVAIARGTVDAILGRYGPVR